MALRRWRAFWTIVANIRQPEPEELPKNMHAVCSPSWEFLFTSFWARYMVPSVSVASQCHITQINYCQRFDKHRIEDLEIEVDIHGRKAWIVSYHSCARQSDISAFLTGIDPFNRDEGDRICLPKNGDLKRYITGVPFNYDVLYTLTLPPGALSLTDIAALFNAVSRQDIYALSPKTHSFWHASAVYDSIKTRLGDGAETRRKSKLRRGVLDFEKPREISEAMDAIRLEWGKSMAAQHRAQEIEQAAQKRAQDIEKDAVERQRVHEKKLHLCNELIHMYKEVTRICREDTRLTDEPGGRTDEQSHALYEKLSPLQEQIRLKQEELETLDAVSK